MNRRDFLKSVSALASIIFLSIMLGMVAAYPSSARRALTDLGGLTIIRKADRRPPAAEPPARPRGDPPARGGDLNPPPGPATFPACLKAGPARSA